MNSLFFFHIRLVCSCLHVVAMTSNDGEKCAKKILLGQLFSFPLQRFFFCCCCCCCRCCCYRCYFSAPLSTYYLLASRSIFQYYYCRLSAQIIYPKKTHTKCGWKRGMWQRRVEKREKCRRISYFLFDWTHLRLNIRSIKSH